MCNICLHRTECMEAMGHRLNKVPVSKARFNLVPEVLQTSTEVYNPDSNVHTLFYACHESIFCKPCRYRIPSGGAEKIIAAAQAAACDLRLFIGTVMMAHQEVNPTEPFYPNMLFGSSAIKRVNLYRKACRERFGHFDLGAFNKLRGKFGLDDLDECMLRSEILFGELIIGCRLRSDESPFDMIYRVREPGFDTIWLAIEDSYRAVLEHHVKSEVPTTEALSTLRHNVFQVKKSLKSNKSRMKEAFSARERILPQATQRVLSYHRLSPSDFEIENEPVVSASAFWIVLGKALRNYYYWQAINGDKHAMALISRGT